MGLDSVEIVLELEQHFGISIPDRTAEGMRTVDDIVRAIADILLECPHPIAERDRRAVEEAVFTDVQRIVSAQLALDPGRVSRDARLVEDLGVD